MPSSMQAARAAGTQSRVRRPAEVRAKVERFDAGIQPRIAVLVGQHHGLEDLMWSFPGAIHALAAKNASDAEYMRTVALVCSGAPLRMIAKNLGLPMWARRLAPDAFSGTTALRLPNGAKFANRIVNHIPADAKIQRTWLECLVAANESCDADFALWVARHVKPQHAYFIDGLKTLGVFASFSMRAELPASRLIESPWRPDISLPTAIENAEAWFERLNFEVLGSPVFLIDGPDEVIDGFEIVPLRSPKDFLVEATAMKNCLAGYASDVSDGSVQIWSIRRDGERVGLVELNFPAESRGVPRLYQLRGPNNDDVPDDVATAVYRWLLLWPNDKPESGKKTTPSPERMAATYQRLLKPYWKEKGFVEWCPRDAGRFIDGSGVSAMRHLRDPAAARRRARRRRR